MTQPKPKKKYWYLITSTECPICGKGRWYRERKYTKRPKTPSLRRYIIERYDYCQD